MNFPDTASVHRDASDPTTHGARLVHQYPTDPIWRQRCENFLASGFDILPVLGSVSKGVAKKQHCLIDQFSRVWPQIDDRKDHFSCPANELAASRAGSRSQPAMASSPGEAAQTDRVDLFHHTQNVAAQDLGYVLFGVSLLEESVGDARQLGRILHPDRHRCTVEVRTQANMVNPGHLHGMVDVIHAFLPRHTWLTSIAS